MSDCVYSAGRRELAIVLVSGVAIGAWALFPNTVERGTYVPLPEASMQPASDVAPAREDVVANPTAYKLINAKLIRSTPATNQSVAVSYASPVVFDMNLTSLRSKLEALLMLVRFPSSDVDSAAVEAKLRALLKLPDSALLQVFGHPDLADFNTMLDAVFSGSTDLRWLPGELDKVDVVPVTETSDRVDINGSPVFIVEPRRAARHGDGGLREREVRSLVSSDGVVETMPQADEAVGVTSLAAVSAPSNPEFSPTASSAPVAEVWLLDAPTQRPASSSRLTGARLTDATRRLLRTASTFASSIFRGGNAFGPGAKLSDPISNNSSAGGTATPPGGSAPGGDVDKDTGAPDGAGASDNDSSDGASDSSDG